MSSPGCSYRGRELIGDPGLDLADARDQLVQIVEGQHGPQRRRRVERGAQEKVQVTPTKADQAADHRDRHDVPDLGHEIDVPIAQRSLHAPHRNLCDLGLERSHAPGDQLGEDCFPVYGMNGRIGGRKRLYAEVTERQTTREPMLVAVEQTAHVRRELFDPGGRIRHHRERAHEEHLGTGDLPHRSLHVELAVEGIGILDHLRIEQERRRDLFVDCTGSHARTLSV